MPSAAVFLTGRASLVSGPACGAREPGQGLSVRAPRRCSLAPSPAYSSSFTPSRGVEREGRAGGPHHSPGSKTRTTQLIRKSPKTKNTSESPMAQESTPMSCPRQCPAPCFSGGFILNVATSSIFMVLLLPLRFSDVMWITFLTSRPF